MHLNGNVSVFIDPADGRFVGATFVHRDLLRLAVLMHRFLEKLGHCSSVTHGTEQKVNGGPFLVDGTIQVLPLTDYRLL